MSTDGLTPTSFAVLGLLASGPLSAYELTERLRTSAVGEVWPRSRSSLYREPKKLVDAALASVRREKHRGPERSVYAITGSGRAALSEWLASPSSIGQIEEEALLKVCFVDHADRATLLALVDELRSFAATRPLAAGLATIHERGLSQPERAHVSLLMLRYMFEIQQAMLRWCAWVDELAEAWPDDLRDLSAETVQQLADDYRSLAVQVLDAGSAGRSSTARR